MALVTEDGLEVVLSPLQLAAVLENDSVEESSSMANRFWGAATLVGGAIEMVGAAALILTPEPTMVTKIAGGALAVHGADTTSTGLAGFVGVARAVAIRRGTISLASEEAAGGHTIACHVGRSEE
jgi:hypothetical protein